MDSSDWRSVNCSIILLAADKSDGKKILKILIVRVKQKVTSHTLLVEELCGSQTEEYYKSVKRDTVAVLSSVGDTDAKTVSWVKFLFLAGIS